MSYAKLSVVQKNDGTLTCGTFGRLTLSTTTQSRDQIKHIWVRAGLWFRAPCSLYYLQIKHTADDFICGRLYWLPHDNAAGYLFLKKWLTVPWQWFSRLRCDRTGEHLDEAHLNYFFFGKPVREKVPVGLNLTSLEEVNTVWCDPERGAGGCAVCGGGKRSARIILIISDVEKKLIWWWEAPLRGNKLRITDTSLSLVLSVSRVSTGTPCTCLNLTGPDSSTRLYWDR